MHAGWHSLRFQNGQPQPWHHDSLEIAVDVPIDGHVTLLVTGVGLGGFAPPSVAPAPGSEGAVWLKGAEPPQGSASTE